MIGFYITKQNDTLQRLAAKFYGNWRCYKIIYDANFQKLKPFEDNKFPSGIPLEIPELNLLDEFHIVAKDDSYESISNLYYATENYSEFIKSKNDSVVLKYNLGKEILIPSLIGNL